MKNIITHYSRGLYSTWTYLKPYRLLIDAGEGVTNYMGNRLFAVERIFLSHGHLDHIAGLVSLFGMRRAARGDHEKPLEILSTSQFALNRARQMFAIAFPNGEQDCPYTVTFRKVDVGLPIKLNTSVTMEPVKTHHTKDSAGVLIYSTDTRLREPFRSSDKFLEAVRAGKQRVTPQHEEQHNIPLFLNLLDNHGVDFEHNTFVPEGVKFMIDDLTFPEGHENEKQAHNDIPGAVRNANLIRPEQLLLSHISSRYVVHNRSLARRVRKWLKDGGLNADLLDRVDVFHPANGLDHPYTCDAPI